MQRPSNTYGKVTPGTTISRAILQRMIVQDSKHKAGRKPSPRAYERKQRREEIAAKSRKLNRNKRMN